MNLIATIEGERLVQQLLCQLAAILVATRVCVWLARRVGQTDVSGEILAGLVLGPSVLGALAPDLMRRLFDESTTNVLTGFAQIGLVLLMFLIGLEFDFGSIVRSGKRAVTVVSLIGIVVPFISGYASAPFFHGHLPEDVRPDLFAFRLFFAVAMSITAVPVLGRILTELGLSHTRTAALVIGAASIDDVIGWILLGVISLVIAGHFSYWWVAWHVAVLGCYVGIVFLFVRPALTWLLGRTLARNGRLSNGAVAGMLVVLFISASATSQIGVFAIIGGFVIGVALHDAHEFATEWKLRVAPIVHALLLPLYFTYTGIRTDIGSLGSVRQLWLFLAVLAVAFASKLTGAYAASRAIGMPSREAGTVAVCMNTRGLMELVVINIGYEMSVLPRSMYTKLVLMAIVSTFIATPLIRLFTRDLLSRPRCEL